MSLLAGSKEQTIGAKSATRKQHGRNFDGMGRNSEFGNNESFFPRFVDKKKLLEE